MHIKSNKRRFEFWFRGFFCQSEHVPYNKEMTLSHLPWCKNGVVQEVFKDFSVGGVGSFGLQVLD